MKSSARFTLIIGILAAGLHAAACYKSAPILPAAKSAPTPAGSGEKTEETTAPAPPSPGQVIGVGEPALAPAQPKGAALIPINPTDAPEIQARRLTDALNVWEDWNGGKAPATLNQLVEKQIVDRIPTPPQGMKFVIDTRKHVVELKKE
jgi:hypothetical protein